jgi:hypothetical protein
MTDERPTAQEPEESLNKSGECVFCLDEIVDFTNLPVCDQCQLKYPEHLLRVAYSPEAEREREDGTQYVIGTDRLTVVFSDAAFNGKFVLLFGEEKPLRVTFPSGDDLKDAVSIEVKLSEIIWCARLDTKPATTKRPAKPGQKAPKKEKTN